MVRVWGVWEAERLADRQRLLNKIACDGTTSDIPRTSQLLDGIGLGADSVKILGLANYERHTHYSN